MRLLVPLSGAIIAVAVGAVTFAHVKQGASTNSAHQGRLAASAKAGTFAAYEARIKKGGISSATLYYDTVDHEGVFEPADIVGSSFSETCNLSGPDLTRILSSLRLLQPIRDREVATNYVNMALVFHGRKGARLPVYFFYSIDGGKVNAVFGGTAYRTSSDFPRLVVGVARQRCGRYWPFPFKV